MGSTKDFIFLQFFKGTIKDQLLQGPISIAIGVVYGFIYGLLVGKILPSTRSVNQLQFDAILIKELFSLLNRSMYISIEIFKWHSIHNDGARWTFVCDWQQCNRISIGRRPRMHHNSLCVWTVLEQ